MKRLFCAILVFFSMASVFSQSKQYEISAKDNALMCPFMGPRLTKQLESIGAVNILKSPTHVWTFEIPESKEIDKSKLLETVQRVGYNPSIFYVKINGND